MYRLQVYYWQANFIKRTSHSEQVHKREFTNAKANVYKRRSELNRLRWILLLSHQKFLDCSSFSEGSTGCSVACRQRLNFFAATYRNGKRYVGASGGFHEVFAFLMFVSMSLLVVDETLEYVMRSFWGVARPTVPIPLRYTPKVGPGPIFRRSSLTTKVVLVTSWTLS